MTYQGYTSTLKLVRENADERIKIESPVQLSQFLLDLQDASEESVIAVMLDNKHVVCGIHVVSIGTLNASLVHPREVFKAALLHNAHAVALAHNHPSGDPMPSGDDRELTTRLKQCGELLGIALLDHVIIGDNDRYYSFQEENTL